MMSRLLLCFPDRPPRMQLLLCAPDTEYGASCASSCKEPAHKLPGVQSLVMASLFAWMEGLFALGYRPKLQQQMQARVQANQAAMDGRKAAAQQPLLNEQSSPQPAKQ